ncbi:GntR family transcriptional regulator [Afifella pfennigii]|uniref:GntR family transcriptional regulator n=1 Tax=Afifella pfennigii TaxID=209897 RepID=UPI000691E7E3|nr:GntR family transcriptional regulator [Afifella pfennigii]
MLTRVKPNAASLRNQVADMLRSAIAVGALEPGRRLRERVLCEELGISRTSLREALRILESEGIVTSIPHRGVVVAAPNAEEAEDSYRTRAALECLLVRQFTERASRARIDRLADIVAAMTDSSQSLDVCDFARLMREYYAVLLAGASNRSAAAALSPIFARVTRFWVADMSRPGRIKACAGEVQAIVAAMSRRDEDAAEAACKAHHESLLASLGDLLAERGAAVSVRREVADCLRLVCAEGGAANSA